MSDDAYRNVLSNVKQSIQEEKERPFKNKEIGGNIQHQTFATEFDKGMARNKPMNEVVSNASQKASEAQDEAKRESSRGIKPMKKGGKVKSASSRADGCCERGKTKGRFV